MKKVYKYATGVEIPEGAIYLSTQVETESSPSEPGTLDYGWETFNRYVWHYFLVEVGDKQPRRLDDSHGDTIGDGV
jgi:hypothetical protein